MTSTDGLAPADNALVVGAGTMGCGIAQALLEGGFHVTIREVDEDAADRAGRRVVEALDGRAARGRITAEAAATASRRLTVTASLPVDGAFGLVVESVPESLALKRVVLDEVSTAYPSAVIGTNTSALSIDRLADAVRNPELFAGLHFFNPVPVSALVEVVRGSATTADTLARCHALAHRIGKESIEVADAPGFATSRLGIAVGLEAVRMLEQGVASAEDIDKGMVLGYRFPMGPLALSDLVGLDVRLAIADHLCAELGDRFLPPDLLRNLVARGDLGAKSGRGFYQWSEDRRPTPRSTYT